MLETAVYKKEKENNVFLNEFYICAVDFDLINGDPGVLSFSLCHFLKR